ncbi:type VII secretion system-associated protein [Streptomyces heilongjiangensis]|uniref:Type VII secretion system-associated protein n=1 Tax=Streptomyces heilongjiangensis TaxID=945052 RepID=A0ABW1B880_9ACTN|nr:type VII secretion system-associated protein [Streptomyces heilongjiangensis]MDC2947359.1 type VII secretion system-associated protein [Streptomyces heilongjiangensis]
MRPGERQEGGHDATSTVPEGSGPTTAPGAPVTTVPEPDDVPGIPEAVRAAARRAPGHWIGMVDPEWTEERTPPEWAVLGEWRSDDSGGVGDYRANPAYRPSARVLGWPEPTDPVDAAAQRAATGYGSVDDALAALAEADVTVARGPDGGPLTAVGRDGAPVVLLFTSPAHEFMSAALSHDTLPAAELARSLSGSGTQLMVNAGAVAPLLVPADSLLAPAPVPGPDDERAPATDAVVEGDSGALSGTTDRTGRPATATATSADLADNSPEPRPHITGRTP